MGWLRHQMRRKGIHITHWTYDEKIAASPDQWHLDEADYRALEKTFWVVTEKIHGAHFCIITDGSALSSSNRKRKLTPDDNFFEHRLILQRLEEQIYQLFLLTKSFYPELTQLSLYGELFGGAYPHPKVTAIAHLEPIQTGIYYTPDIEFCSLWLISWKNLTPINLHFLLSYQKQKERNS